MKLIIGNWCFCPGPITSLLALLFFSLFTLLGFWQLDRADQKRALYADFENRQSAKPINLNRYNINALVKKNIVWRHINATGEFVEQYQILLDNQVEKGHAGYFIYTPFKLAHSKQTVLVNRGWLPAGSDRTTSPALIMTSGIINIEGIAKEEPKAGLLLKRLPPEQLGAGVYRVQHLNIGEMAAFTKMKLLPFIIRLEPESEHGYRRRWQTPGSGERMHMGYAFQWFAFAATLLIIYLVMNISNVHKTGITHE